MKENKMYSKVSNLFEDDYYVFYNYVIPDNSKREIDLVCLEKCMSPEIIAVEVKVRNWKRALRQAFKRMFYVDRCYIALLADYVNDVDLNKVSRRGIGLIAVDGHAEIVMKAKKSDRATTN